MPDTLKKVLNSPLAGLSPWIVMSLVSGSSGRFELSVGLAFALSVLLVVLSVAQGSSLKFLELSDTVFFGGLGMIGLLASATRWSGSNSGRVRSRTWRLW